jgi:hypothetical protein
MIAAGMQKARLRLAAGPFYPYFYCNGLGKIVGQEMAGNRRQGSAPLKGLNPTPQNRDVGHPAKPHRRDAA